MSITWKEEKLMEKIGKNFPTTLKLKTHFNLSKTSLLCL